MFHSEDDWEYFSSGFIAKSFHILQSYKWISMVALLDKSDYWDGPTFGLEETITRNIRFSVADGARPWTGRFAGIQFNPGLRRLTDYRLIGPYGKFGQNVTELMISIEYLNMGFRVALLSEPAARHIGGKRHVIDPFQSSGIHFRLKHKVVKRWLKLQEYLGVCRK